MSKKVWTTSAIAVLREVYPQLGPSATARALKQRIGFESDRDRVKAKAAQLRIRFNGQPTAHEHGVSLDDVAVGWGFATMTRPLPDGVRVQRWEGC